MKWFLSLILVFGYVTSHEHDEHAVHPPADIHAKEASSTSIISDRRKHHDSAGNEIITTTTIRNDLSTKRHEDSSTNSSSVPEKTLVETGGGSQQPSNPSSVQLFSELDEKENDDDEEKTNDDLYEVDDDEHEEYVPEDEEDTTNTNTSMPPDDPEKIDSDEHDDDCETWIERANDFLDGDYDAFSRLCGESVGNSSSTEYGEEVIPDLAVGNFFRFSVYMTLPPNWQSTGNTLDDALTGALDHAFPQYRIMTDHVDYNWGTPEESIEADIVSYKVKPSMVREDDDQWWWQYSFKYFCYVPGTTDPIDNKTGKEAFESIMDWIESAESKLDTLNGFASQMQGVTYDVQMHPPNPCDECVYMAPCYGHDCELSPTYAPPTAPEVGSATVFPTLSPIQIPSIAPSRMRGNPQFGTVTGEIVLDPSAWDWRRYTGLVLLLTTVMGTLCLSQTARLRNTLRDRKEDWGNLATEEGVDVLLQTGWKVRGSLMEIYDRKNVGYRDSDSMLIGGYEQRVMVGSEIAVSRTQSETVVGTAQS